MRKKSWIKDLIDVLAISVILGIIIVATGTRDLLATVIAGPVVGLFLTPFVFLVYLAMLKLPSLRRKRRR